MNPEKPKPVLVWDLPLRLWHWAFALSLSIALATALIDGIQSIAVHQWAGISAISLLVFRLTWGVWGGLYAKWWMYYTTPKAFFNHFLGRGESNPHTAPGIVLSVILLLAAFAQASTGLFMTDDIFFDGPLRDWLHRDLEDAVYDIHHNAWWLVICAIGVHLTAQLVYGVVLKQSIPIGMITGRKRTSVEPTEYGYLALIVSLGLAASCFLTLAWLADKSI